VAGQSLDSVCLPQFELYCEMLARWNAKVNLTALTLAGYPNATIDRLLIEPLIAATQVSPDPLKWVDLGSGGGSPAIPLKIVRPNAALVMVEARSRKAAFLREVARALDLRDVTVINGRFEELTSGSSEIFGVHLVTARGIKLTDEVLDLVARIL